MPASSTLQVSVEPYFDAGVEVVGAVGGRGVDRAGALIGGDVVGEDAEDVAIEKRVLKLMRSSLRALEAGDLPWLRRGCTSAITAAPASAATM